MSPKSNHDIRRVRGKRKGQFTKKKVVQAREKLLKSVAISKQQKLQKLVQKPKSTKIHSDHVKMNRAVDLTTLGNEMWCSVCDLPISLRHVRGEQKYGVASVLTVECMRCRVYNVPTFLPEDDSYKSLPINLNVALGMIDNGLGESHINGFYSSYNMPTISPVFLKKNESKVGLAIEEVAKESCLESIRLEKQETLAALQKKDM